MLFLYSPENRVTLGASIESAQVANRRITCQESGLSSSDIRTHRYSNVLNYDVAVRYKVGRRIMVHYKTHDGFTIQASDDHLAIIKNKLTLTVY